MFGTWQVLDAGLVVVDVVDSSFVMEWNRNNEERAIEVGMLVVEVSWAMGGIFEWYNRYPLNHPFKGGGGSKM